MIVLHLKFEKVCEYLLFHHFKLLSHFHNFINAEVTH